MNDFLKNLKNSVDTSVINENAITKINDINNLVIKKYGEEKIGTKMSQQELSNLEQKIIDIAGGQKNPNNDMLEYLEALKENVVSNTKIKIEDTMNKIMYEITENYYSEITGLLLDEFGVTNKEIEDIEINDIIFNIANNLLSKICLFEVEYCDYLETSTFYYEEIVSIKNNLIKIVKNK